MTKSRVIKENFIIIQGWMITELDLKGNELVIYACIYGFSQAEGQTFKGSLQYLADWTNSTKQGVIKCLKSLVQKGLLEKNETIINGVKFCEYHATKFNGVLNKVEQGSQQSLIGGMQQSLTNNIPTDNKEDKKENNKKESSFDIIIATYAKGNEEIKDLLGEWLKVRKAKRSAMTDKAIQMNVDKLDKLAAESKMSVTEYLKEVICRGWAAFYKIENYQKPESSKGITKGAQAFNSYPQRQYDYDAMEAMLLKQQNPPETAATNPDIKARAEALQKQLGGN